MQRVFLPMQFHSHPDAFAEVSAVDDERFVLATEACNDRHGNFGDRIMRYRAMVELSPEATLVCIDGKLAFLNQAGCRLLGSHDIDDLVGRNLLDFIHPDHHATWLDNFLVESDKAASSTPLIEQLWVRLDGTSFHTELTTGRLSYDDAPALQITVRDISSRKHSEELQLGENRILNMIATGSPLQDILMELATFAETLSTNGLCSISLFDAENSALSISVAPNLPKALLANLGQLKIGSNQGSCGAAAHRGEPVVTNDIAADPVWESHRDDILCHGVKASASWPIFGKHQKILGTFALYFHESSALKTRDVRLLDICANLAGIAIESRASEDRIRYLAHYDGLTSLPNRFLFSEYLDLALRNAQRNQRKFAVFFIDLDKFKEINDTLGHEAGDQVLQEIAHRLRSSLRHTDKIARMGGDEFYVLIEELADSSYAADVALKLLNEAVRPMSIQNHTVELSMSIGIAIYPDHGMEMQTLLKNADSAMYRTKESGKNGYQLFNLVEQTSFKRMRHLDNLFASQTQDPMLLTADNIRGGLRP